MIRRPVWALTPDGALARLETDEAGLTDAEAERRLAIYGLNELAAARTSSRVEVALRQFRSPLIYILVAAAIVTLLVGEFVDAGVIAAVLLINATIAFVQERNAERSMEALRRLSVATARVLRGTREREVDARCLVPGDIVLMEAGGKVPADCRVLHAAGLEVDESLLTGESATVGKRVEPVAADALLGDRACMIHTGTVVTRGHCRALVTATGAVTELGRVASSVVEIGETATPLQRRMKRFANVIGVAVLGVGALGLVAGVAAGDDLTELFLAVVALAVSAIPEGLPIVLTIVLAMSIRRMAARRAIVRKLPAVEALGSCSVIGSDKTGTLTENRMTVLRIVTGNADDAVDVSGTGYDMAGSLQADGSAVQPQPGSALYATLVTGVLCNDATTVPAEDGVDVAGDPTEIALLVAAAKAGLFRDELEERHVRLAEIPFDPALRLGASFNDVDGAVVAFVKGRARGDPRPLQQRARRRRAAPVADPARGGRAGGRRASRAGDGVADAAAGGASARRGRRAGARRPLLPRPAGHDRPAASDGARRGRPLPGGRHPRRHDHG